MDVGFITFFALMSGAVLALWLFDVYRGGQIRRKQRRDKHQMIDRLRDH
jgi:hypothetical protein